MNEITPTNIVLPMVSVFVFDGLMTVLKFALICRLDFGWTILHAENNCIHLTIAHVNNALQSFLFLVPGSSSSFSKILRDLFPDAGNFLLLPTAARCFG